MNSESSVGVVFPLIFKIVLSRRDLFLKTAPAEMSERRAKKKDHSEVLINKNFSASL